MTPGESNSATVVTGACCEPLGGCTDDVTQATCLNGFGTWFEAQLCSGVTCPPAKGACCMPDGGCVDYMTAAECDDYCYNSIWHQTVACTDGLCIPQDPGRCCMYIGVCIDVPECECTDLGPVLSGDWDGEDSCPAECTSNGWVAINEIRIDQPSTDYDEYFELTGTPNMSLMGLTYLVIGDGPGGSGVIEEAVNLHNQVIPPDGSSWSPRTTTPSVRRPT